MPDPLGLDISPDGSKVYVGNRTANTVSVINTISHSVITTIPVVIPWAIAISPNGDKAYVTQFGANQVSVINTSDNCIYHSIQMTNVEGTPNLRHLF